MIKHVRLFCSLALTTARVVVAVAGCLHKQHRKLLYFYFVVFLYQFFFHLFFWRTHVSHNSQAEPSDKFANKILGQMAAAAGKN